ncbi:MAG: flagellar filament capping protein FliD [Nitrospinae bacterium]|nr:flagellar filament capping protein FliD [Nitrospinota bacterium]
MAITSIFGISSGFDTASLVEKLIALQARPMDLKLAQVQAKETKLEAFQSLRTHLQTFQSVLNSMGTVDRFNLTTADFTVTAGTGNVLSVATSSSASVGTHDITVNALAQETTLLSDTGYSASTDLIVPQPPILPGTYFFDIDVGGAMTQITVDPATDTIQDVVNAINASAADVTASIIDDGSAVDPFKIVIQGNQPGTANAVTALLFRMPGMGAPADVVTFTDVQTATDASVTVDGITFARSSNTINDIIPGVTLNLESLGSGTLTISTDNTAIALNIQDFVDAFNELIGFIDEQTEFNAETFQTGILFGNSAVQSLETTLRRIVSGPVTGVSGTFGFLSQIGITTQDDGTLILDEVKLDQALTTDLDSVVSLFTSSGTASDANVTFVGFTDNTVAGIYDVQVVGGVPQLSPAGAGTFVDAVDNGAFFTGAAGTDAEGLSFSMASLVDASYGTITLSLGVIPQLNQHLSILLDSSQQGPLTSELDSLTKSIDDLNDTLLRMDDRLELFEKKIRQEFINLEIILGRLNAQRNAFQQALQNLSSFFDRQN